MNLSSHRPILTLVLACALLACAGTVSAQPGADAVRQTLEQARDAGNRSVTVHVHGATVSLLVTAIEGDQVVGRSAQHGRIVVRIDRIDAIAF